MKEKSLSHEYFIRRCLQLAENGMRAAMPNPCVGAVLVHQGRIIGEGHTSAYGGPHGEVNAIHSVKMEDRHLIPSSTLYVSLEPCSHHGKTPPCADLIINEKISKVVIGTSDPNSLVAGNGLKRLRTAGVEVFTGVLEEECKWSLRKFLTYIQKQRPFVTLKWAQSVNACVAQSDGTPVQITGATTKVLTHRLRVENQAILCGWRTVKNDRPELNNRLWAGPTPQVIIFDLHQRLNDDEYFKCQKDWWRLVLSHPSRENDIVVGQDDLSHILIILFEKGIQSLFVEGGTVTHNKFIANGLWDECYVYENPLLIENGLKAPQLNTFILKEQFQLENDCIRLFLPDRK